MQYSDIKNIISTLANMGTSRPIYVEGPPGVGKTALAYAVADELEEPHEVTIFRPSLRDPVDLMGVPHVDKATNETHWSPPHELSRLRTGRHLLVIDELPQAPTMMQNALAGLMLDRFVGELVLGDDVIVMATGNRTRDKAGANRIVSQLGNRVMRLEMDVSPDDWQEWALDRGIDPMMIAFLRFKPGLLFDFDPDRFTNATPRAWEFAHDIPADLPSHQYLSALSGVVGEGAATEYVAFRRMADRLPNIDRIVADPAHAEIPEGAEVMYACTAALVARTSVDNFPSLLQYVERMPSDYQVLYIKNVTQNPALHGVMQHKSFTAWSVRNQNLLK